MASAEPSHGRRPFISPQLETIQEVLWKLGTSQENACEKKECLNTVTANAAKHISAVVSLFHILTRGYSGQQVASYTSQLPTSRLSLGDYDLSTANYPFD